MELLVGPCPEGGAQDVTKVVNRSTLCRAVVSLIGFCHSITFTCNCKLTPYINSEKS